MQLISTRKADKAREIAQSALTHFTQKGYLATSLESIAAGAGVGKSTIYEYYRNKEDLFAAAVQEAVDQWFDALGAIKDRTDDPMERLEQIAHLSLECGDYPPKGSQRFYFEVLMQTVMEGGVFFERKYFIRQVHQKIIQAVADILLEGVSRGQLKPGIACDAQKIAITYLSFLDGLTLGALVADDYIDVQEQISLFVWRLAPLLRLKEEGRPPAAPGSFGWKPGSDT